MISILSLWAPIAVAAVLVFALSSLIHMVFNWHKSDYRQLPKESEALDALRALAPTPGVYPLPYCASAKEMGSPEMLAKYTKGPVGMLVVMPSGPPAMGKFLGLWFGYCVLVGVFVAYLAGRTLPFGADYLAVFRVAGTVSFLAYGVANVVDTIWKGFPWSATIKHVVDGLLYSLVTAGAFGWLWPR